MSVMIWQGTIQRHIKRGLRHLCTPGGPQMEKIWFFEFETRTWTTRTCTGGLPSWSFGHAIKRGKHLLAYGTTSPAQSQGFLEVLLCSALLPAGTMQATTPLTRTWPDIYKPPDQTASVSSTSYRAIKCFYPMLGGRYYWIGEVLWSIWPPYMSQSFLYLVNAANPSQPYTPALSPGWCDFQPACM